MFGKKKYVTQDEISELTEAVGTHIGTLIGSVQEIRDVIDEDLLPQKSELELTIVTPALRKLLVDRLLDVKGGNYTASEIVAEAKVLEEYICSPDVPEYDKEPGVTEVGKAPSDPWDDEDPYGYGDTPFGGEKSSVEPGSYNDEFMSSTPITPIGQAPLPGTEISSPNKTEENDTESFGNLR